MSHTPLPWAIEDHDPTLSNLWDIVGANGLAVGAAPLDSLADAKLIVRAVNAHAELLAALEDMMAFADNPRKSHGGEMLLRVRSLLVRLRPEEE